VATWSFITLFFLGPIQRSSFATASDDRWQNQVLQMSNYYHKLDLSGVFQPDSVGEGNNILHKFKTVFFSIKKLSLTF